MRERQTAIRAKTFRAWLLANLDKSTLRDLSEHGADAGFPGLTYTHDCVRLFDKYGDEIWEMAAEECEGMGYKSVPEMVAHFVRVDMANDLSSFKNLMVWYAAESIAREITDGGDDES